MATGNARRLNERGMPNTLAVELAKQITASTGDFRKLRELGLTAGAKQMAAAVASHTVDKRALVEHGIVPAVVTEFAAQIAS